MLCCRGSAALLPQTNIKDRSTEDWIAPRWVCEWCVCPGWTCPTSFHKWRFYYLTIFLIQPVQSNGICRIYLYLRDQSKSRLWWSSQSLKQQEESWMTTCLESVSDGALCSTGVTSSHSTVVICRWFNNYTQNPASKRPSTIAGF